MFNEGTSSAVEIIDSANDAARQELQIDPFEADKVQDECGVASIRSHSRGAAVGAVLLRMGSALVHRGNSAGGVGTYDETTNKVQIFKQLGRFNEIFSEDNLDPESNMPRILHKIREIKQGIAHTRYSTNESDGVEAAHPHTGKSNRVATVANGQWGQRRLLYLAKKVGYSPDEGMSDAILAGHIFDTALNAESEKRELTTPVLGQKVAWLAAQLDGAFCGNIQYEDKIVLFRDAHGVHPLSMGRGTVEGETVYASASETVALDAAKQAGMVFDKETYTDIHGESREREVIYDIKPGQVIVIDDDGAHYFQMPRNVEEKHCLFEHVYIAHEESVVNGAPTWQARFNMGLVLAEQAPVLADMVIGVPKSGLPAAYGYAERSGIPLVNGIEVNPEYAGLRTFLLRGVAREILLEHKFLLNHKALAHHLDTIAERGAMSAADALDHEQLDPELADELALVQEFIDANGVEIDDPDDWVNELLLDTQESKLLEGKDVVAVDDSGIKGNVSRQIVKVLRQAGARNVHFRYASPRYEHACDLGMDTANVAEFIARPGRELEEIAADINATTVAYNTVAGVEEAVDNAKQKLEADLGISTPGLLGKFCTQCTVGEKPDALVQQFKQRHGIVSAPETIAA